MKKKIRPRFGSLIFYVKLGTQKEHYYSSTKR